MSIAKISMRRLCAATVAAIAIGLAAHAEVPLGDDGLHKPDWLHETFKDMREDLAEANAEGKRLMVIVEQRGCIYCTEMHEKIFVVPEIETLLREKFFVVQMNLYGATDVTDFDGTVLPEKEMARRWGIVFTPTLIFLPEDVPADKTGAQAAVVMMPGAFGKLTTQGLLQWVLERGYEKGELFQEYLTRTNLHD